MRLRFGFGETLTVRYDPDAPEKSVRQGAMTRRSILTQAGLSVVFCLVGYCLIRRACPKGAGGERSGAARPKDTGPKNPGPPKEPSARRRSGRPRTGSSGRCANWCGTSRKSTRPWIRGAAGAVRPLEAAGYAPARYEAWLIASLGRNRTILESGPDTGEWPDARDRITRIRGGKLTVSDGYGQLSRELEAITADYEAGPDAYAENKAASDEMLREACRVEWIG